MRCSYPQRKRIAKDEYIVYPCGKCNACRRNRAKEWGFRAYVESLSFERSIFLSLTYDDEHLPIGTKGYPTLCPDHLVTFWKDFRYYVGKCRYMACGEYGDKTHRPHYHAIVFGVSLDNSVFFDKFYSPRKKAWIARCKAWRYGEVCIGEVTIGSCNYCAKYVTKRKTGKSGEAYYAKYGIEPEFARMSRRPGLGYDYLIQNEDLIRKRNYVMLKGHKLPLPRYYVSKLYEEGSNEYELYKIEKAEKSQEALRTFYANRDIGHYSRYEYMKKYLEQQDLNLEKQQIMKGY